ncbi:pentatricopeptide repeat-containing protein At3g14580, mitochondrial [Argentina anserina]|uniref:pentatricopeptide repeat-containing protein At3g14580, mitochondrial n=1 Tax=Argentina anserina TaxID=57926 RepID=UPI0021767DFE|nr:pentatricopeptide repeat-containing protein At3g14580, mitochondrial [Potentilla anserina]
MISRSTKLLTHPILQSLTQYSTLTHTPSPSLPQIPKKLHHKDWLSPTEVLQVFTSLPDPTSLLPTLHHYSTRKDYKPTEALYTLIIDKLSQAHLFDSVDTIISRIKSERNCRLSDDFFRNVIRNYGNVGGYIKKAMQTLYDMPGFGCWPSVKTFNLVLHLLVSTKMFEVVHEVYLKSAELGVEVDACSLNIMIKGLCECGKVESAVKVLDEFPQQKCVPNALTFSTLMHGLCGNGKVDEAFGLLKRMEDEGVDPDSVTFNILIAGLRRQKRNDEGIELLEKMKLKGCAPNPASYQEGLYCLLDAGRFVEAREFMIRMVSRHVGPSFVSYKQLIQGLCKEDRVEELDWVLRQMMRQGFVPKMGMWRQIIRSVISKRRNHCCVSYEETIDDLIT